MKIMKCSAFSPWTQATSLVCTLTFQGTPASQLRLWSGLVCSSRCTRMSTTSEISSSCIDPSRNSCPSQTYTTTSAINSKSSAASPSTPAYMLRPSTARKQLGSMLVEMLTMTSLASTMTSTCRIPANRATAERATYHEEHECSR